MKQLKVLLCFLVLNTTQKAAAQEMANYYIFASTQKIINTVCGTGELIIKEERRLPKKTIGAQKTKFSKDFVAQYSSKNGYRNNELNVIEEGTVIIYYKTTRVYVQGEQWNCVSTKYASITASNFLPP